jgi:hypothetical protein
MEIQWNQRIDADFGFVLGIPQVPLFPRRIVVVVEERKTSRVEGNCSKWGIVVAVDQWVAVVGGAYGDVMVARRRTAFDLERHCRYSNCIVVDEKFVV